MGYEPLHHKYRPQTFTQLVGQDAIAQTLSHALEQQRIAPAYLFCGPRGTGKTSSARILAKSLNCLTHATPNPQPCGQCEVCLGVNNGSILDIVEIDAASNTGVDNIRELIERAQFAPVQCRYKVYVVDECHMLSTAAFNALLKTLEEPPDRVIFVLATTDPQRVLPTIISRCQRFDFRRIPLEAMVSHLTTIAQQEAIDITDDALRLVAQVAQGGLRDAESLLDQLSLLAPPITAEKVWDLVGAVPERDLLALVQAIAADDSITTLDTVRRLMDRGREPIIVLQNLAGFYRDLIIAKTAGNRADLVPVTPPTWEAMQTFAQSVALPLLLTGQKTLREAETQLRNTTQPRLWLEVTLMNLLPSAQVSAGVGAIAAAPAIPARSAAPVAAPTSPPATPPVAPAGPTSTPPPAAAPTPPTPTASPTAAAAAPPTETAPPDAPVAAPPVIAEPTGDAPATDNTATTPAELVATWAQVIAHLQPMGTRALLQQQGHLIHYDGRVARIGIKSKPLFKMAQGRVANIEAAFEQLFSQPVKVTLEVADAPPDSPSSGAGASPSPAPPSLGGGATAAPATTPAPYQPPSAPYRPATRPEASPPPAVAPPTASPTATPTTDWQPATDLDRAVKSFAEFFNGQIVNLDDDENEKATSEQNSQSSNGDKPKPSSSPGSDVPF
ncbi:MAG: DNA polymerase III subunit gamma/tau [Cyanobacteria bacterium P01_E01_bin.43]